MIYTLTLNPSIDYVIDVPDFAEGKINNIKSSHLYAGGKGINVSRLLNNVGKRSVALGFAAGVTGRYVMASLSEENIASDFVYSADDITRINVKMKSSVETECNGRGPAVSDQMIEQLYGKIACLKDGDILVLSGSIPCSISFNIYAEIISRLQGKKVDICIDSRKMNVLDCLKYNPYLLKPNIDELGEMFDVKIHSRDECIHYASLLQQKGAKNILLSLGKDGGILCAENHEVYYREAPKGALKNSVGAGDSMLAGYLSYIIDHPHMYEDALKYAIAAGSATAFGFDIADREMIENTLLEMD